MREVDPALFGIGLILGFVGFEMLRVCRRALKDRSESPTSKPAPGCHCTNCMNGWARGND